MLWPTCGAQVPTDPWCIVLQPSDDKSLFCFWKLLEPFVSAVTSLSNIHRRERKLVFPPTRPAEIPPHPLRGCCRTHVGYKTAFDISNYRCITVHHIRRHSGMQAFIYQDLLIGFHVTRRPKARGSRGCGCLTAVHLSGPSHWHAP